MWILILSLVFDGYKAGGAAVTTQEFQSKASCYKAGEIYVKQHTQTSGRGAGVDARWSCVKK